MLQTARDPAGSRPGHLGRDLPGRALAGSPAKSVACSRAHTEIRNARTGQVLPLYPDVLDDIERNADSLDIEAAAGRIAVPWLIIHGTEDESRSASAKRSR